MDTSTTAFMGCLIAYSGDWDHGCALVEFAMQLNPQHPGWYWLPNSYRAYRQRDYRRSLDFALRVNMAGYFFAHAVTAAVCGQQGMRQAAEKALQELLAIRPDFATADVRNSANGLPPTWSSTFSKACARRGWRLPTSHHRRSPNQQLGREFARLEPGMPQTLGR